MAFEEKDKNDFNEAVGKIFHLKSLKALDIMTPLKQAHAVASNATVREVRSFLSVHYASFVAMYHRNINNIVAIALLRDLLHLEPERRVLEHARSPWFVTQETPVLQILDQFRANHQNVAVILGSSGQSVGLLSLNDILEEILGSKENDNVMETKSLFYIERTLDGDMFVSDFNIEFQAALETQGEETLSGLFLRKLGHPPVKGEEIRIDQFLFTVLEPSLLGAKTVLVQSFDPKGRI